LAVVRRVTGEAEWEAIAQRRREDLLVYLALARFGKRPKLSQLPRILRADMRVFFGSKKGDSPLQSPRGTVPFLRACRLADELLFRAGDPTAIDEACKRSPIGKLLPDDLYIHRSAPDHLEPILRIYEGCGRARTEARPAGRARARSAPAKGGRGD
jgi:DNA phosphorothioation-associated putative methyltransferase